MRLDSSFWVFPCLVVFLVVFQAIFQASNRLHPLLVMYLIRRECKLYKIMDNYRIECKKGEGTYSIVYNAVHKQTGDRIALKIMKQPYENIAKIKKRQGDQSPLQLHSPQHH